VRRLLATTTAALLILALGSASALAQPEIAEDDAVSQVLSSDPDFAELSDFRTLEIQARSTFDWASLFGSGYYRVLPTLMSAFSDLDVVEWRQPANWIIEVALVRGCSDPAEGDSSSNSEPPMADPCEWRHHWYHQVAPDGTVTVLFEEGDPLPVPSA
jgi:hypothetical protein